MQGNGTKLIVVLVLVAAGYGGYRYFAKNVSSKTDDELFQLVAAGGMKGSAAETELGMRAGSGRTPAATFRAHLKDSSKASRVMACKGIGGTKDKASAPALLGAFADEEAEVRAAACEAFVNVRVKEAVEPLLKMLDDSKEDVRIAASAALRSITGQSYSNKEPDKWREWWASNGSGFKVKE